MGPHARQREERLAGRDGAAVGIDPGDAQPRWRGAGSGQQLREGE